MPNVPQNLGTGKIEKLDTGTFGTNPYSTLDTSVEFNPDKREENSVVAHSIIEKKRSVAHPTSEINSDNSMLVKKNNKQENREHIENVPNVPQNLGTGKIEKMNCREKRSKIKITYWCSMMGVSSIETLTALSPPYNVTLYSSPGFEGANTATLCWPY